MKMHFGFDGWNETRRPLKGHKAASVAMYITKDGKEWGLISYSTYVIRIKNNVLTCSGTYSATTRKHIGWFLREYLPELSYRDIKEICEKRQSINLKTGEQKKTRKVA